MTDEEKGAGPAAPGDDGRVAEINALTAEIRVLLQEMVKQAREDPAGARPAELLKKIGELHSAHLKVVEKEEAFHAKLARDGADAIDYDRIRAEIGRKLDRIRAARGAEGLSGGAD